MTVLELINKLRAIEDKNKEIVVSHIDYDESIEIRPTEITEYEDEVELK